MNFQFSAEFYFATGIYYNCGNTHTRTLTARGNNIDTMACKRSMDCTCPQCAAASAEFSSEDLKQFSSTIDYGAEATDSSNQPEVPPSRPLPKPAPKRRPKSRLAADIPLSEKGELDRSLTYYPGLLGSVSKLLHPNTHVDPFFPRLCCASQQAAVGIFY